MFAFLELMDSKRTHIDTFFVEQSDRTPSVRFDYSSGEAELKGVSLPENALAFYNMLIEKVGGFRDSEPSVVKITVDMDYFNSISSKCLYMLFKEFRNLIETGKSTQVVWYHDGENESVEDFALVLQDDLRIPVELTHKGVSGN
ncbi:MAG: DUF1987 domain-containing protein [Flavobacteriales bacterium]